MDYERGNQANGCLDRFFKLTKHGTSVKTEIFAGITMFIASVYILAVIPNLLSVSGMPHGSAVAAVILTTAFATMLIGFVANVPVIVANQYVPPRKSRFTLERLDPSRQGYTRYVVVLYS